MCKKRHVRWEIVAFSMILIVYLVGCVGGGCDGEEDATPVILTDYSLGEGSIQASWISNSGQIVHDHTRSALYRLGNQEIIAVDLENGAQNSLVSLPFDPAGIRLTTDDANLYILETEESADADNGRPDLVQYDIQNDLLGTVKIEIDSSLAVEDFIVTTNGRVVVACYNDSDDSTLQNLYLYNTNGELLDTDNGIYSGYFPDLALNWDQETLVYEIMGTRSIGINVLSINGDEFSEVYFANRLLAFGALNTYEPNGDRLFRSSGEVLFGEETDDGQIPPYIAIDFDLTHKILVLLVRQADNYLVGYYDLGTLALLSEQELPQIEGLEGFRPAGIWISGGLYLMFEDVVTNEFGETFSGENKSLVRFNFAY